MADIKAELYCPDCDEKLLQKQGKTYGRQTLSYLQCPVCEKRWIIGEIIGEDKFSLPPEEILKILQQKYDFFMKEPEFPALKIQVPYAAIDKVIEIIKEI